MSSIYEPAPDAARLRTGVAGLDTVLNGGFLPGRHYMLTGDPGTGKTLLGLQYLLAGVERGEACLIINLEERESAIRSNAASTGLDLTGIEFLDLASDGDTSPRTRQYDIFPPGEVEGPDIIDAIHERIETLKPDRVFIDPLTQLRRLAAEDMFRVQMLDLMHRFTVQGSTVLFTSQATEKTPDDDLQFISDGTIELRRTTLDRTLTVPKFRGSAVKSGVHAFRITDDGLVVYPVLEPGENRTPFTNETISTGVEELDALLHGGIERGTITLLSGPTGVGKTTLGTQVMREAAVRGERSVIFTFEETAETLLSRSAAVGIPAAEMVEAGTLVVEPVLALERSAAEFASMVRTEVEEHDARIVMLDGIDGYRLSIRGPDADLERELNSLCRYLKHRGVAVLLVDSTDTITGDFHPTSRNVSYLADTIVFLRYLEMHGELRKAMGILKKRTSDFERTLREFTIDATGFVVGDPLTSLRGILSGTPEFIGDEPGDDPR